MNPHSLILDFFFQTKNGDGQGPVDSGSSYFQNIFLLTAGGILSFMVHEELGGCNRFYLNRKADHLIQLRQILCSSILDNI